MRDYMLGGVVLIPGLSLVIFWGVFFWLIIRVFYIKKVRKYDYVGNLFDISMLFLSLFLTHLMINSKVI